MMEKEPMMVTSTEANGYKIIMGAIGVVTTVATVMFIVWSGSMSDSVRSITDEAKKANIVLSTLVTEMTEIKTIQKYMERDITYLKEEVKKLSDPPTTKR